MRKHVLGVIGGLGPSATAHFMELVIQMTDAPKEQDNVNMIVYNFPSIPDRTGYILGSNLKSPLPGLLNVAKALERQKVSYIAVPCVTAHFFHRQLQSSVSVPVLDGIAETVDQLKRMGIRSAGIMATDGTVRASLLSGALEKAGICPVLPSPACQKDVMHLIYKNIKAGKPAEMDRFTRIRNELMDAGAEIIILGCTELSLIKRDENIGPDYLDIMEVLAREAVLRCGKKLKPEYQTLFHTERNEISADQCIGVSGANRFAFAQ